MAGGARRARTAGQATAGHLSPAALPAPTDSLLPSLPLFPPVGGWEQQAKDERKKKNTERSAVRTLGRWPAVRPLCAALLPLPPRLLPAQPAPSLPPSPQAEAAAKAAKEMEQLGIR